MATSPYVKKITVADKQTLPIVLYARSIQKNTAEFTQKDLRNYLRWLWKVEPIKKKLCVLPQKKYWGGDYATRTVSTERSARTSSRH